MFYVVEFITNTEQAESVDGMGGSGDETTAKKITFDRTITKNGRRFF